MAEPRLDEPLPPRRQAAPRHPLPAVGLSLLLPGLGQVYTGQVGWVPAFLAANVLGVPAVQVAWALGEGGPSTLLGLSVGWSLGTRALSAGLAAWAVAREGARPRTESPAGVYGVFVLGSLLLSLLVNGQVQRLVPPPIELTAAAHGYQAGDWVLARRLGNSASPRPGSLALYLVEPTDAGHPLEFVKRDAFVAVVTGVSGTTFTVEGRDGGVDVSLYLGVPAGVARSAAPGRAGSVP